MRAFDGTPDKSLTGACVRAIQADYSCAIGRDRNRAMAPIPGNAEVDRVIASPRPSCGGKSILDLIWDELMEVYGEVLEDSKRIQNGHDPHEGHEERRGQCVGLATAIAILVNPYAPNVDAVRTEARERWEGS